MHFKLIYLPFRQSTLFKSIKAYTCSIFRIWKLTRTQKSKVSEKNVFFGPSSHNKLMNKKIHVRHLR